MDGCGLSNNTACHDKCLSKKLNVVIAIEGLLDSSNKTGCFSYKGEWLNA